MKIQFSKHAIARFRERCGKLIDDCAVKALAADFYKNSSINRTIRNNTRFMTYMYEKYGYEAVEFRTSKDAVYVVRDNTLITVYSMKDSMFHQSVSRFRK